MNQPTNAGRRMRRIIPDDQCCTGDCVQGRQCPRYTNPIKSQPVIGTAPFVWTGVILVVIGMVSGAVWLAKVLYA